MRSPDHNDYIQTGNSHLWVHGYGTTRIQLVVPGGVDTMLLYDVAYCPDVMCNLVSFKKLRAQGLWWDNKSEPTYLRKKDNTIVAELREIWDQWVIDYKDRPSRVTFIAHKGPSSLPRKARSVDSSTWHQRLGHPGPKALEHLICNTTGTRLKGVPTIECDDCAKSKLNRQISRRPRQSDNGPGETLAIDWHDYEKSRQGYKRQMLCTDRYSGFSWDFYCKTRKPAESAEHLRTLAKLLKTQYNIKIKVIESDGEIIRDEIATFCREKGISVEPSAPNTQSQNGKAERSGGVVKDKARSMRGHLPENLWPEINQAAVYLLNRIPSEKLSWRSPYEVFHTTAAYRNGIVTGPKVPNLSHLRVYGCKAFAMTDDTQLKRFREQRLDPKAWIGYLIGYQSSNIWRIWVPPLDRIINTRDVIFNENYVFDGKVDEILDSLKHQTTGDIAELVRQSMYQGQTGDTDRFQEDDTLSSEILEQPLRRGRGRPLGSKNKNTKVADRWSYGLPTPPVTPPPVALLMSPETIGNERILMRESGIYEDIPCNPQSINQTASFLSHENALQTDTRRSKMGQYLKSKRDAQSTTSSSEVVGGSKMVKAQGPIMGQQKDTRRFIMDQYLKSKMDAQLCRQSVELAQGSAPEIGRDQPPCITIPTTAVDGDCDELSMFNQRIQPWAAAFMAGAQSAGPQTADGKIQCKATTVRRTLRFREDPFRRGQGPLPSEQVLEGNGEPQNCKETGWKGQGPLPQRSFPYRSGEKPHRSSLPDPPTRSDQLKGHCYEKEFQQAERDHLQSHRDMNSWTQVRAKPIKLSSHQILDCMWVYTYKLDKHHRLVKCKARLVVRGDQQKNLSHQDTYAATLANRSFRTFMSICARFDLNAKQYDVTNAFVHAGLDRPVYMRMPPGYRMPGMVCQLNKALYGLRISPLLWQKHFTTTLLGLRYTQVPHEPCCFIKDGVLIFFYVDDVIVAYADKKRAQADELVRNLKNIYTLTGGDDLQWFLGVQVIRNRVARKIWLSQAQYVNKIHKLCDQEPSTKKWKTPMGQLELLPYKGTASPSEINRYQKKIGSLLFAAVNTRPDIAFATSRLARFLTNPGPNHHLSADRVLQYLAETSSLALCLGGEDKMEAASDASFADNTIDRRSSQGYAIKLFGGLIAWRASKQDTVTTSTTEAELLSLSQVAKEVMYTTRLLKELSVTLEDPTGIIFCDNRQTIRLATQDTARLQTKLRHVDIHNLWLRQEVKDGSIKVQYIPTKDMIADGLTKSLPLGRWTEFLDHLGLEDVAEKLLSLTIN
jgi:hypothetical protein